MQTVTIQHLNQDEKNQRLEIKENFYPPLGTVTRSVISTNEAAYYLNRKSQTLRAWACLENGPLCPIRINGRLAWPIDAIRELLKGGSI